MHPRPVRKHPDTSTWSSAYICYVCERERKKKRDARFIPRMAADYRILAGVTAYAGNTPVCWRHYARALDNQLRAMITTWETGHFHPKYEITVHHVRVDEHGMPYLGDAIFSARPKGSPTRS